MTSILSRMVAAVSGWLGMNDPSENHLHQAHGWLLPAPATVRTPVAAPPKATDRIGWHV